MLRVLLSVLIMLLTGHWVYVVIQMANSVEDAMRFHELAGQASLTGWALGFVMLFLLADYMIGENK